MNDPDEQARADRAELEQAFTAGAVLASAAAGAALTAVVLLEATASVLRAAERAARRHR